MMADDDDDETDAGTGSSGAGLGHLPIQEGLPPGVNVVARVGRVNRGAFDDADALALILDEHQAGATSDGEDEDGEGERMDPAKADIHPARDAPDAPDDTEAGDGNDTSASSSKATAPSKRGFKPAPAARELVKKFGEFGVFIAVEADQRPPEVRRPPSPPPEEDPGDPGMDAGSPAMDAEDVEGAEGAVEGDNPLESFEAFGSWFNKQVESVAEQFNGGTGESDSDEDDDSIDGDVNHDDDVNDDAKKTPASPKVKSPKKKSRPKSPAARRRDSENDRIRERREREADAIRRYRPSRPKAAAANLAARCGVRVGRILSVGTMHLVPPPGGSVRNGGSIDAGDEEGGADDFSSSPTGDLPEGGGGAGGEGPETEREKAERERNAGERARAMSELYRKMMDEQDRGAAGPTEGDDDGDKGGGDKGGDLTNYVDDAEIEAMLGETEAANEWSKVSDREYAWVKAVGKTCQAAMVEKTLGLIERYAPLRAYVRYWATVARADETLDNSADAAEQAKAVAANTLGQILVGAAEGVPSMGFVGAAELAASHRRRDPSISAGWLKALIYGDSTMSSMGGTILSLGGPAAAPVTAPPALAMYFTIRLRLCLAVASLGGADVLDPEAGAATLACFFGTDARELLDARPFVKDLDALIAAASDAANAADDTKKSSWLPDVSGAMSRVFETGASAQRVAQRSAAVYAERAAEHAVRRSRMGREAFSTSDPGDVEADAKRAYENAYRLALPREMVRAMGEHVFTAANMVVVAAELVPFVSSYLTVRAANAAIKCHLPHLAPAAEAELENAKDSDDANAAAATPNGGWTKDITEGASKVASSVGAAASTAAARTSAAAAAAGAGIASLWTKASETAASTTRVTGLVREGGTTPVPRLADPDAPKTFHSIGSGGVV